MRFFFDNNLAPPMAKALDALSSSQGHEVIHLIDMFEASVPDIDWLTDLGKDGDWIIISGDQAITRRQHEKAAWLSSGLTAFFLAKGWINLKLWDQAAHMVKRWPEIMEQAKLVDPGAGFLVPIRGKFQQVRLT